MKKRIKVSIISLLAGILLVSATSLVAQDPTYTASLENDLMTAPDIYEFDIVLARTGVTSLELANFQAAILVDPAFINGGAVTTSIIPGSSDLNPAQQPQSITFSETQASIKIAPMAPPRTLFPETQTSVTDGTIIPTQGTRVCRVRLDNSVPFATTQLNPVWNFTIEPYRTTITAFLGPADHRINTSITLADAHSKSFNLTLLTEGLYNSGTGMMNKVQDVDDDFNTWDKFPGMVADTLSILLAEANSPWNILWAAHGINLNTNGHCRVPVPGDMDGNYYVIAKHRNSIETWSKTGGVSFTSDITSFDLSTAASQAYGNNLKPVTGGKYTIYSGDVGSINPSVQDGYIDFFDLIEIYNLNVISDYGYQAPDLTGDGFVDFLDLIMAYNNNANGIGMVTPLNPNKKK